MADNPDIIDGTVAVTNGTKIVTGVGTLWSTYGILAGDTFGSDGYPRARIESVDSDTSITLKDNWQGPTLAPGSAYWIRYQADSSRYSALLGAVRKLLTQPILTAFGGLTAAADKIPYFTSASTMALVDFKAWARTFVGAATLNDALPGRLKADPLDVTNLDTITETGWYNCANGSTGQPFASSGLVEHLQYATLSIQNYYQANTTVRLTRSYNGTAWSAWTEMGVAPMTAFAKTLLDDANAAAALATLGAVNKAGDTAVGRLVFNDGVNFGSFAPASGADLSKHVDLFGGNYGMSVVSAGFLNFKGLNGFQWVNTAGTIIKKLTNAGIDVISGDIRTAEVQSNPAASNVTGLTISSANFISACRTGVMLAFNNNTAGGGSVASFFNAAASVGGITVSGTATAFVTSSDYRLKNTIESLVEFTLTQEQFDLLDDTLLRVMSMRPVRHKWNSEPNGPFTHGFIAHQLQQVAPHAVTGVKDGMEDIGRAVKPSQTVPGNTIPADPENDIEATREPDIIIPEEVIDDIPEIDTPEGFEWTKTGERPAYQGVDTSKLVADLTAAVQSLTLMVLQQQERISVLENA
jgi:hypothetical protein